jgi:hypothetical protein
MSVITQYGSLNSLQDSLTSLLCDIRDLRTGEIPRSIDLRARCIVGSVRGHPILGNRARVHTSELILIDPENRWARTWSRYYLLGAPERPATGSGSS